MAETVRTGLSLLHELTRPYGKRIAILETNRDCNRSCSYCKVPSLYRREQEQTVDQTLQTVDWIYNQGFRLLSYLGGEPFAPIETKERITFAEQTLQVVNYASQKGMMVNVVTNGDYLTPEMIAAAKKAGVDSLSLSLHSFTKNGLGHLVESGRSAAQVGIIPTVTTVLTSENANQIPGIAAHVVGNGLLYGFGIVQTKDQDFSTGRTDLIPSVEQQREVAQALLRLKMFGFVRNNRNYIQHAVDYYPNNWTCNPNEDTFIHIGAGGTVDVCTDIRTNLHIADIPTLSTDKRWREAKQMKVKHCGNCTYQCYVEAEKPQLAGDLPMIAVGLFIRTGKADIAQKWGQVAVAASRKLERNTDWSLHLK